jgi:pimeloyl-ACP methyl ester carboxylesterase
MARGEPDYGGFRNGIPYVRFGEGTRELVLFYDGPGNELPTGSVLNMIRKAMGLLTSLYRVNIVSRKPGLTEGYTTRDMSNDYAEMIEEHFSGKVDLVIGMSYGGLIAQHFAADHPNLFNHIVLAMTALRVSAEGIALDEKYGELLSEGKSGAAYKEILNAPYPPAIKKSIHDSSLWLASRSVKIPKRESFASDILIEVKAEKEHDPTGSLHKIKMPVLVVSGDRDYYFPVELVREMEHLVPNSIVRIYAGRGRDALEDSKFAGDVIEFVSGKLRP